MRGCRRTMALAARFNHTVRGPVLVSASLRTFDLGPFQLQNFPLSATRQENQSDYVGRMLPGRPFIDQPIQRTVKPVDFLGGQKASEFRAGVSLDALRRVGGDQAGRDGGIQDLTKQLERLVRAFGCCQAVGRRTIAPQAGDGSDPAGERRRRARVVSPACGRQTYAVKPPIGPRPMLSTPPRRIPETEELPIPYWVLYP